MGLAIVYPPTSSPNIQIGGGGSRDSGNRAPDSPGAKNFSSTYLCLSGFQKKRVLIIVLTTTDYLGGGCLNGPIFTGLFQIQEVVFNPLTPTTFTACCRSWKYFISRVIFNKSPLSWGTGVDAVYLKSWKMFFGLGLLLQTDEAVGESVLDNMGHCF